MVPSYYEIVAGLFTLVEIQIQIMLNKLPVGWMVYWWWCWWCSVYKYFLWDLLADISLRWPGLQSDAELQSDALLQCTAHFYHPANIDDDDDAAAQHK